MIAAAASAIDAGAVLARLGRPVRRITSDSRVIAPGDAFAAYPGETRDGRAFIPEAMRRGAGGVLWETKDSPGPPDGLRRTPASPI